MQLHRHRDKLDDLHARVLLIAFSTPAGARAWREETGVSFPILLDPGRRVYRAYGLEASLWRAWQPKVWWRYAQMLLSGWRWRGIRGDSAQLGGDFVVDPQGRLRRAWRSADPTDRPGVATLLVALADAATMTSE